MPIFFLIIASVFVQRASATFYDQSSSQFISKISDSNAAVALVLPVLHILPSEQKDGTFHLETFQMENSWNICQAEPLAKAPSLPTACTGFLIAPDILVTAGHCMVLKGEVRDTKTPYCEAFSFVFGYRYEDEQNQKLAPIKGDQIAHCKKVIYATNTTEEDPKTSKMRFAKDFAIVQLDRRMSQKPITLIDKAPTEKDFTPQTITMTGHPFGMPLVESKGTSLEHKGTYLLSAINSFPGNSGSPVKNKAGEVIGLLVRGYPQGLIENNSHKCSTHNRCDEKAEKCVLNGGLEKNGEHIQILDQAEVRTLGAIIR